MKTKNIKQTRSTGEYDANVVVCMYEDLMKKCLVDLVEWVVNRKGHEVVNRGWGRQQVGRMGTGAANENPNRNTNEGNTRVLERMNLINRTETKATC